MRKAKKYKENQLYVAYGSNLNTAQMAVRCPTAEIVGKTMLRGWRLMFRGVATVERFAGYAVPVLVWKLQPEDEAALDRYEGWPHLYRKETLRITVNKKRLYAMVYIMNAGRYAYSLPSKGYLETILDGYEQAKFDKGILWQAVSDSAEEEKNGRRD